MIPFVIIVAGQESSAPIAHWRGKLYYRVQGRGLVWSQKKCTKCEPVAYLIESFNWGSAFLDAFAFPQSAV